MIIITTTDFCDPWFLCYCLNSFVGKIQFKLTKIGSALSHTSVNAVSKLVFPIAPIEEQIRIVSYLSEKCAQIDQLITLKQTKIDKLNEYKKSLIYEYVTGKREA